MALLAAVVATIVSVRLFSVVGQTQPVWLFPGFYLVEVASLTWFGSWVLARGGARSAAWACTVAGALMGFSILGVWSIGLFYLPVVLLSAIAGGLAAWRMRLSFVKALAAFAAGCAAQIVMMLAIVRWLPSLTILACAIGTRHPTFPVRARTRGVPVSSGGHRG